MDIVFITGGDVDKSGNALTALYHKPRVAFEGGKPVLAGLTRATLSFKSVDAMLSWASKEHFNGAPCFVDGARVIAAPAAPEKPGKAK